MRQIVSWQVVLAFLAGLLLLLGVVIYLPHLVYPALSPADLRGIGGSAARIALQNARYQVQNDFRGELLQTLAALFVVAGAVATWQQIRIARDGQITDRFTRAIDQLGSEKLDVRLGGIYGLERLAMNSPADRPAITPILGAFVRGHAPWPAGSPDGPEHPSQAVDDRLPWLTHRAVDVQTAMHVRARRPGHTQEPQLFLSRSGLRKMLLAEAMLCDAYFRHSNLAGSWMPDANLEGSHMADADLRNVNLRGANLSRAGLRGAHLQHADLSQATLRSADLRGANLTGAILDGTDLRGIQTDNSTIWPPEHPRSEDTSQTTTQATDGAA